MSDEEREERSTQHAERHRRPGGAHFEDPTLDPGEFGDPELVDVLPAPKAWPKDLPLLPKGKPKGAGNAVTVQAKRWAAKFIDDPRWEKMIWFWVENPEMMPAGVFTTIMFYKFGKPAQTLKVKGEIMARPYLGETPEELSRRARQLADRLAKLNDPAANAKLINGGDEDDE